MHATLSLSNLVVTLLIEWRRLLQSSLQSDSEEPLFSPPLSTKGTCSANSCVSYYTVLNVNKSIITNFAKVSPGL